MGWDVRMSWRKRVRRARMGVQTALGLGARGFFMPYRYAASAQASQGYPEIEALFAQHEAAFAGVLDRIEENAAVFSTWGGAPPQPRWDQAWFPVLDALAASSLVREHQPKRLIEVGSGHSTRFLVAAGGEGCAVTCIDPQPRAAVSALPVTWERALLSEAHLPLFDGLEAGDVAFFDSSHLLWPGLDVDLILNRILPRLAPGVLVHIHDIFLPDPYPDHWAWRGYTEQNGLGGWLMGGGFTPVFSSQYAVTRMDALARPGVKMYPRHDEAIDTSLWMVKNAAP